MTSSGIAPSVVQGPALLEKNCAYHSRKIRRTTRRHVLHPCTTSTPAPRTRIHRRTRRPARGLGRARGDHRSCHRAAATIVASLTEDRGAGRGVAGAVALTAGAPVHAKHTREIEQHFGPESCAAGARARAFRRHPADARGGRLAPPRTGAGRGAAQDAACPWSAIRDWCWRASRGSSWSSPPPRTATRPRANGWRWKRARCSRRWPTASGSGSSSGSSKTWRSASCGPTTTAASRRRSRRSASTASTTSPSSAARSNAMLRGRRHRRRGVRAAEAHLQHPAEDGAQAAVVRAGVRPARGAHRHAPRWRTATRRWAWSTARTRTSRGEFDDYIATPKDNFYRSIHTAVLGPEGKAVEVQIRTREMHDQAELGLAAHWRYKEARARTTCPTTARSSGCASCSSPERRRRRATGDFLDEVRSELFEDRVYALTPKGEVVDLPHGATPLDFAYHVHTDLGHRCRGARVNGRIVPLTRALANGEIVEIITHKHPQPSRDWLSETQGFLTSPPRSRSKVRAWFRKLDEDGASRRLAAPVAAAVGARATPAARRQRANFALPRDPGRRRRPADQLCAVLRARETRSHRRLRDRGPRRDHPPRGLPRVEAHERPAGPTGSSPPAGRTSPLPQPVTLTIVAIDRQGLVRDIGDLLASEKMSIEMMHTTTDRTQSTATIDVRLGVDDTQHLTRLLQRIRKVGSVLSVRRSG